LGDHLLNFLKKTPELLQSIAAIWLILVAITIFAEVTFRNFGLFLGADQIVQNSVPAIVFLQVPFAIASGTMLRTTLIYDFFKERGKRIVNRISYIIGVLLFTGIAIGGWTDMIKGWEIGEYQGIGAIEFPVYPIRTVIIFSSIIIVIIYSTLIIKTFVNDKKQTLNLNL
jgi:TRAP-type C4-dicarboxylate transport system permease small subunit